jgi:hypothetical protein
LFIGCFRVVELFRDKFQLFAAIFLQGTIKTGFVADVALAGIDGYL